MDLDAGKVLKLERSDVLAVVEMRGWASEVRISSEIEKNVDASKDGSALYSMMVAGKIDVGVDVEVGASCQYHGLLSGLIFS